MTGFFFCWKFVRVQQSAGNVLRYFDLFKDIYRKCKRKSISMHKIY